MQQNRNMQLQKNRATTPCKNRYPVVVARLCLVCAVMLLSACSSFSVHDQPLKQWSPEQESHIQAQIEGDRSKELAVMLAFSGGGTRAAAFSFGVLEELAATEIVTAKGKRSLLQSSPLSRVAVLPPLTMGCMVIKFLPILSHSFCTRMWKGFC